MYLSLIKFFIQCRCYASLYCSGWHWIRSYHIITGIPKDKLKQSIGDQEKQTTLDDEGKA